MLDRIELEAFIALAEELHFGRTAERLLVTPGRVSQVIKRLERRIGAPLFDRTSRSVRLTAPGRELYGSVKPAYDDIADAVRRVTDHGRGAPGRLRAGFACQWCGDLLQAASARAADRLSGLRVQVLEIDGRDRASLAALRAGTVDVQLTALPVTDADVVVGPAVLSDRRALAVPADHRLARQAAVRLADLAGECLVTVGEPADSPAGVLRFPRHTPAGRPIGRGPVVATWQDALVNVGAGRGVAPASMRAALYHARPGVAYVPIIDAPAIQYALMWLRSNDHERMRAFARVVGQVAEAARADVPAEAAARALQPAAA